MDMALVFSSVLSLSPAARAAVQYENWKKLHYAENIYDDYSIGYPLRWNR